MKSTAVTNLTFVKQGTSIKGSIAKPTARPAISRSAFAAAALGPQKLHFENDTLTRTMEEIVILATLQFLQFLHSEYVSPLIKVGMRTHIPSK